MPKSAAPKVQAKIIIAIAAVLIVRSVEWPLLPGHRQYSQYTHF
jgi:hypothetical protein